MSAADHAKRRIVIKRFAHEEEDHGGQWKIAYADFVTAMMAFFLIMWLLNTVDHDKKLVIARYFSAASVVDFHGGDGVMDGSPAAMNGGDDRMTPIAGSPDGDETPANAGQSAAASAGSAVAGDDGRMERQRLDAAKAEFDRMTRNGELKDSAANVSVENTADGLRLQIFDRDGAAMFAPGSAEPGRRLTAILDAILPVLAGVRNGIIISGHTDDQPMPRPGYGNWELSADRANGTRRYLEAHGLDPARFVRVEGRAASDPLLPQAPADPRNRRITLTLLRADVAARMRTAAPAR